MAKRRTIGESEGGAVEPAAGTAGRVASRDVAAFAATVLAYAALAGGLLLYAPALQTAVLVGVVAGMSATRWFRAAAIAAAALGIGVIIVPPMFSMYGPSPSGPSPLIVFAMMAGAAAAAALVRLSIERTRGRSGVVFAVLFTATLVVNLWATAITVDSGSQSEAPLFSALSTRPALDAPVGDAGFFLNVHYLMRDGVPYYQAYRRAFLGNLNWAVPPRSIFDVRLPTLFALWRILPGGPPGIVYGFLVLVSFATAASVVLASQFVRLPFAVISAGAVASYYLYDAANATVLYAEPWGSTVGLLATTFAVMSLRSHRGRLWLAAAVVLAVVATAMREHMVYVLLAALGASALMRRDDRRLRVFSWSAGLAAVAMGYVVHANNAGGIITGEGGVRDWAYGGVWYLIDALRYGTQVVSLNVALPFLFAALGVAGALLIRDRDARIHVLLTVMLPLVGFLVVGNETVDPGGDARLNYWGKIVVPVLYALVPLSLLRIPGVARVAAQDAGSQRVGNPGAAA